MASLQAEIWIQDFPNTDHDARFKMYFLIMNLLMIKK